MRVTSLKITNFRSIVEMPRIELSGINVLVGPNNAGKSSLIRALYSIQQGSGNLRPDMRVGATESQIEIELGELNANGWLDVRGLASATLTTTITANGEARVLSGKKPNGEAHRDISVQPIPNQEPTHAIVPYLAKRKAMNYNEDVRLQHALSVAPQLHYLAAKLSRLGNSSFPGHDRYVETCRQVLGFVVSAVPSENGQRPGVFVDGQPRSRSTRWARACRISSRCSPSLHLRRESCFCLRHLGAAKGSLLYSVDAERGALPPVAKVAAVPPTAEARLALLRDLGYSFSDFDLWEGWLILEESSAERIIRDYLVPCFAPMLTRIRTVSAGGNSEVEATFEDFNRLVRFTHLEDAYRDRVWVIIDGDEEGQKIIERLRNRYESWQPERFACLDQGQFERYYPAEFADRVAEVLAISDRKERRDEKGVLLQDVLVWLDEDRERAKMALESSASDVIARLRGIQDALSAGSHVLASE